MRCQDTNVKSGGGGGDGNISALKTSHITGQSKLCKKVAKKKIPEPLSSSTALLERTTDFVSRLAINF